ncbi:MAG: leucine-rich repeat domain-containing protein [Clostridia bacterium]|nr:leucine-rich repeat domain-containing protein [Clostridia bacterium]
MTSIGGSSFSGCTSLETFTMPDSVTSLGYQAFYGCSALSSVTIGGGITSISSYTFSGCTSLETIVIPTSVTQIRSSAFIGCSSLETVYYCGDSSAWSDIDKGTDVDGSLTSAKKYYYSEIEPDGEGFWHLDEDGEPTVWETQAD